MPTQTSAELKSILARAAAEANAVFHGEAGIFKRLIAEHAELASLLQAVTSSDDVAQRSTLFERLKAKLTVHTEAEEKEFYALLEGRAETAETIQIHVDEHRVMAALLTTVQTLNPASNEWEELVGKLRIVFVGHVQREEASLFEASKGVINQPEAEKIEARFVDRKEEEASRLDDPTPQHTKFEMPLP